MIKDRKLSMVLIGGEMLLLQTMRQHCKENPVNRPYLIAVIETLRERVGDDNTTLWLAQSSMFAQQETAKNSREFLEDYLNGGRQTAIDEGRIKYITDSLVDCYDSYIEMLLGKHFKEYNEWVEVTEDGRITTKE